MIATKIQKFSMHKYTYYMFSDEKERETINVETDYIIIVTHIKSNKNRDIKIPSTKQH